jgi:hypothetical protein
LNFIFGIVCLFVCVCAFSLRRESPDMILGDKPLIFEVVLSHLPPELAVGDQPMITLKYISLTDEHYWLEYRKMLSVGMN